MKKAAVAMVVLGLMLGCGKKSSNQNPVGNFTWDPDESVLVNGLIDVGEVVTFDASSSFDNDGTIQTYAWEVWTIEATPVLLGSGSGLTWQWTPADSGWVSVKLTVTDDQGGTGMVTKNVPVASPGDDIPPVLDVTDIKLKGTASDSSDVATITSSHGGAVITTPALPAGSVTWETGDISLGSGPGVDSNVSVTITAEDGATTPNTEQVVVDVTETY